MPILCLIMLLGGVGPAQILEATLVLAMTALAAGSLGGLIALWREKTFQSLALSVLFLISVPVHGPCVGRAAVADPGSASADRRRNPKLAGAVPVLWQVVYPDPGRAGWPTAYFFALAMLGWTVLLNGWGIWKLRVWNPSGEPIMQRDAAEKAEEADRAAAHAAPGRVREVWSNPILFREIATRAMAGGRYMVKIAYFVVLALVCYYALQPSMRLDWAAGVGLVPITILSLLLVAAQSATAITSERDSGALDLLLVTDLSPREFIFGKLLGILYNTKEYSAAADHPGRRLRLRGHARSPLRQPHGISGDDESQGVPLSRPGHADAAGFHHRSGSARRSCATTRAGRRSATRSGPCFSCRSAPWCASI